MKWLKQELDFIANEELHFQHMMNCKSNSTSSHFLHLIDAQNVPYYGPNEHVLQPMSHLVEQRLYLVEHHELVRYSTMMLIASALDPQRQSAIHAPCPC